MMIWIWLAATVAFGLIEAATVGLVSIWFVVGSAAALVAAVLSASLATQLALFVLVSAAALAVTRPLVRRMTKGKIVPTNADRVLGRQARVTETIDNEHSAGAVYVDGKTWTARSQSGAVIPTGTQVRVEEMEGVRLFVTVCEERQEVAQ